MAIDVKSLTWITRVKLNHNRLISGSISLAVLLVTMFTLQYLFRISSMIIFIAVIVIASVVFWKLLRVFYDAAKCKKAVLILINTSLLILFVFTAFELASAKILMKLDPSLECNKPIECTLVSCPINIDISNLCYFTQQFLAANIQFTSIEVVYLVLAYGFGTRLIK